MRSEIWTEFHYLYRDAGNFKVFGSVALRGKFSDKARGLIAGAMDVDCRFVAEQVRLPALYGPLHKYTEGPSAADVCTHEFSHFNEIRSEKPPTDCLLWGDAKDFVAAFAGVREWRLQMSPNAQNMLSVLVVRF